MIKPPKGMQEVMWAHATKLYQLPLLSFLDKLINLYFLDGMRNFLPIGINISVNRLIFLMGGH